MNRGSKESYHLRRMKREAFNEAPIHESGKSGHEGLIGVARLLPSMRPRFMNRGSARQLRHRVQTGTPSMRPRFMNRGSGIEAHQRLA